MKGVQERESCMHKKLGRGWTRRGGGGGGGNIFNGVSLAG